MENVYQDTNRIYVNIIGEKIIIIGEKIIIVYDTIKVLE